MSITKAKGPVARERVLQYVRTNPGMTYAQIAKALGVDRHQVQGSLASAHREGLMVRRIIKGRDGREVSEWSAPAGSAPTIPDMDRILLGQRTPDLDALEAAVIASRTYVPGNAPVRSADSPPRGHPVRLGGPLTWIL